MAVPSDYCGSCQYYQAGVIERCVRSEPVPVPNTEGDPLTSREPVMWRHPQIHALDRKCEHWKLKTH